MFLGKCSLSVVLSSLRDATRTNSIEFVVHPEAHIASFGVSAHELGVLNSRTWGSEQVELPALECEAERQALEAIDVGISQCRQQEVVATADAAMAAARRYLSSNDLEVCM